jgi:hypothetical protein
LILFEKLLFSSKGGVIVDGFFDEGKYYNYAQPDFSSTKYFPKIIWKSSTKMGVGRAFTKDKSSMFVVTTYDWQGNMANAYKTNIRQRCNQ